MAVRELKRNAGPQHRLWSHHTQVHGMFPDPNDGLRNQCQHFCWYFLPWHRMYLHAFESICRSIIVESDEVDDDTKATWALPYWDYDRDGTRELPPVFREPTLNGAPNPLFEPFRNPGLNSPVLFQGEAAPRLARLVPAQTTARGLVLRHPLFGPVRPGLRRHRDRVQPRRCAERDPRPAGDHPARLGARLRRRPTGKMSDFNQAAGDPIFWLHHANLDRLWEVWRTLHRVGARPDGSRFVDRSFEFLDAAGCASSPPVAAC